MNPRFIRIQDIRTRAWHHLNVNHVVAVTETAKPSSAPHWDSKTVGVEQLVQRLTKENTEWSRVVDKLDLLSP